MKQKAAAGLCSVMLLSGIGMQIPATAQTLPDDTQQYYREWKETFLRKNPYVKNEEQYYVFYGEQTYEQAQSTVEVTVSEAHGYGMLIAVMMSDYDSDAKDIFDGMYRYYLAHPSSIGPHLMAWQQSDNGRALIDSNGADSATDGDLDIAYALLIADRIWGSSGEINYRQAAELIISDIMEYEVNQIYWVPQLGDWAHDPNEQRPQGGLWGAAGGFDSGEQEVNSDYPYTAATRSSDFMPQHFSTFAKVTGDDRWNTLYDKVNSILHYYVTFAMCPLLADFLMEGRYDVWSGVSPDFLESEYDGCYYYNACRTPWRIGTEALFNSKNTDAQKYAAASVSYIKEQCGGDPKKIKSGYSLGRGAIAGDQGELCFIAPLMVAANAAGDAEFHDAIRKEVLEIGVDSYYGSTIAMLCLITDDGGWMVPEEIEKPTGDINADGKTDSADARLLMKWLLGEPDTVLPAWRAGDMNSDGRLDASDLSRIKQILRRQQIDAAALTDIDSIFEAVRNAKPGDQIFIAPGTYDFTQYQGAQKIDTKAAGTADAPILLAASDPQNPPVLTGTSPENCYVLHIQGDWWILDHLICTNAQKGIVLDHSSHTVIRNCEVMHTGAEAIALRDGSSECTVLECSIHDTGLVSPGYGEGVYIGSAYTTTGFDYKCDNNKVLYCRFQKVAAEHVDVKEYTTGTEIAYCIFYGDGMSGENYAGSFIDIAGNNCRVHDNLGYRCQNPKVVAAFEIHEQVEGWGYHHIFEDNTLYLDREYSEVDPSRRIYVVDGWFSDFTVRNNLVENGTGGTGAVPAKPELYNSDYVTFAD